MALNLPDNASQIDKRAKSDVQSAVKNSNPFLQNSWIGATITALANRLFDFYQQLRIAIDETFFDTSTGERLRRQASWFRVYQKDSTKAIGKAVFTGDAGVNINAGTEIATSNGVKFTTDLQVEITSKLINISTLTSSVGIATAITSSEHNLSNNVEVTISGANESEYNKTTSIVIVDDMTFTYQIDEGAPSTATGAIQAGFDSALAGVTSLVEGAQNNIPAGEILSLSEALAGVDTNVGIDADGTAGGTNLESETDFRDRFISRVQNPVAHFNVADIENKMKEVAGVTRVFVHPITPDVGQVTAYFTKDNAQNIIPSGADVDLVKEAVATITPANTDLSDVFILAPSPVLASFNFTSLTPNTATMKKAIEDQLKDLFFRTVVGVNVTQDAYRTAIFNTVDTATGQRVSQFTLDDPTGDIIIAVGELAVFDQVTFS